MDADLVNDSAGTVLDEFTVSSEPGNERAALARVADAVAGVGLDTDQAERLKTAVAEATMNAIEHGNGNRPELDVEIVVLRTAVGVEVSISDLGGEKFQVTPASDVPDLEEKLAGRQTPRGWGLFLIQNMVDAMDVTTAGHRHTVRLTMRTLPAPTKPEGSNSAEQV